MTLNAHKFFTEMEDKNYNYQYLNGEEIQILSKASMIPALRLLLLDTVSLQLLLSLPCGPIDSLQHLIFLITPPIRSRNKFKLNCSSVNLSRPLHMRPCTQVPPILSCNQSTKGQSENINIFINLLHSIKEYVRYMGLM